MVRVVMNGSSGFLQEFLSKIALAGHTIVAKDLSVKLLTVLTWAILFGWFCTLGIFLFEI